MSSTHLQHETPRQRLLRMESVSPPLKSTLRNPIYLTGAGLLLVMFTMIAAGIFLATFGTEFLGPYVRRIQEMSSPFWR